jgi:large subunit ribosomal protein L6
MSRIGRKPVSIPKGVKVSFSSGELKAEGPKGKLSLRPHKLMKIAVEGETILVSRPDESRDAKALHGLTRTLVQNVITGVTTGFTRELDVSGVGYRAEVKGSELHMTLGFSHPIVFKLPTGIEAKVTDDKKTHIVLSATDKQVLGATAAKIRSFRPVNKDPYGLKGVRYSDEKPRKKEGKSGSK